MPRVGDSIEISIETADPVEHASDVLVLKYAQAFYGVDRRVAECFSGKGLVEQILMAKPGECRLLDTHEAIPACKVLIIGVPSLWDFRYEQIRQFARTALTFLQYEHPETRHISLTLHGAGYGLDEIEAFEAEIAGIFDAINSEHAPGNLEKISVVEGRPDRASRLREALARLLPSGQISTAHLASGKSRQRRSAHSEGSVLSPASKPLVFVAMPFSEELDNVYHYGIQGAVRAAGFVCERADQAAFVGDVLTWIQKTIANAALVICDLSFTNPNVYLELGYAWGANKPTVLLVQDTTHLTFDTRGQNFLRYDPRNIQHLEARLARVLVDIKPAHP
jgi:hypothetical protein